MLSTYFSSDVHAPRSKSVQLFDRYLDWQDGINQKVLCFSIDNPLKVIALSVVILFISLRRIPVNPIFRSASIPIGRSAPA